MPNFAFKGLQNKSVDLTRLPGWAEAHIGSLSTCMLGFVCSLPLLVLVLSPWMAWDSRLWTLHLLTYGVGILGFAYGCLQLCRFLGRRAEGGLGRRLQGRWMLVFFGAMLFWTCLSTAFAPDPHLSFFGDVLWKEGLVTQFEYAGLLLLALQLPGWKQRRRVLDCLVAVAALQALLCFLDLPWLMELTSMERNRAIYLNSNHYGYYLCMALPVAAGLLLSQDFTGLSRGRRWALSLLRGVEIALLSHSMMLCRSLGPWLGAFLGLVALVLLTALTGRQRLLRALLVVGLSFGVMALSAVGVWDLGQDLSLRAEDMETVAQVAASPEQDLSRMDGVGSGRGVFWYQAVQYIARHPVFGCGPDNIKAAYEEINGEFKLVRPHSEPLQYAMSIGIPGLLFYLCALWCLLWRFIKNFHRLDLNTVMVYCAIGSYLVNSLVGNTKYYSTPYFFILIGIAWAALNCLPPSSMERAAAHSKRKIS